MYVRSLNEYKRYIVQYLTSIQLNDGKLFVKFIVFSVLVSWFKTSECQDNDK